MEFKSSCLTLPINITVTIIPGSERPHQLPHCSIMWGCILWRPGWGLEDVPEYIYLYQSWQSLVLAETTLCHAPETTEGAEAGHGPECGRQVSNWGCRWHASWWCWGGGGRSWRSETPTLLSVQRSRERGSTSLCEISPVPEWFGGTVCLTI